MTAEVLQMDSRSEHTNRHPPSGSGETSVPHSLLSASLLATADTPDSPGSKSDASGVVSAHVMMCTRSSGARTGEHIREFT